MHFWVGRPAIYCVGLHCPWPHWESAGCKVDVQFVVTIVTGSLIVWLGGHCTLQVESRSSRPHKQWIYPFVSGCQCLCCYWSPCRSSLTSVLPLVPGRRPPGLLLFVGVPREMDGIFHAGLCPSTGCSSTSRRFSFPLSPGTQLNSYFPQFCVCSHHLFPCAHGVPRRRSTTVVWTFQGPPCILHVLFVCEAPALIFLYRPDRKVRPGKGV